MTLDLLRVEIERLEHLARKAPDSLDACEEAYADRPGKPTLPQLWDHLKTAEEVIISSKLDPQDAAIMRLAMRGRFALIALSQIGYEWQSILHSHNPDEEDEEIEDGEE